MRSNAPQPALSKRPLATLVIENEPADVELCVHELEKSGFAVTWDMAETADDFRRHLATRDYDIVLADYNLPGWCGLEALGILEREGKDVPLILVTGTLGEEAAVASIKRGAADYVLKGGLPRLPVAVAKALDDKALREERTRAELALRTSEERYRLLFERSLAGVYRTTLDGQMLDLNEACARMFGYASREEAMHHTLWDISPDTADMEKLIALVQKQKTFSNLEVCLRGIDGRPVWVLGAANLIEGDGKPAMIEGTLLDITERKQLEEQLRQSQKIEAVGRLAGGIAHDFNNLLTAILGYSDIVLDALPRSSRLRRQVAEIKKAGERAASLTRQLLAFSRQQVLAPQVLDLNTVVGEMEKMLRRLIGEDIDLETVRAPDLGRVKADPSQIEQVVMNLAVNSRDAMPEGGKLVIETTNVEVDEAYARRHVGLNPGSYVTLTVSDTGCGMDAETKSRIFEPFFTTKEKGKGTGLGLSTVYGVVKQSGGYIWAESEPRRGATFKVYLPRVEEEASAEKARPPRASSSESAEMILLVEDEEAVRELVRRVLKSKNYRVLEAARGDEALAISESHAGPIRLLLTDVVLPRMSGTDLAQRLAARRPDMRVLFMSGYTGAAADDRLPAGSNFLQKPFTQEALLRRIREVLDMWEDDGRAAARHRYRAPG